MAAFTFDFPEELERQLLDLEQAGTEAAVGRILQAGGKEVEKEMKAQCQAHRQSGSMVKSIKTSKPKKNAKGNFVTTRPTGKEVRTSKNGKKQTVRNMEKLAYLHYGTSKQPATGIVTKVVNRARDSAVGAMQDAFNQEVGGG